MSNINESQDTMWTDWFANSFKFLPFDVSTRLLTPEVAIKAYVRTPEFSSEASSVFSGITSIEDLADLPEWVEARCSAEFRSEGVAQSAYLKKEVGEDDPVSLVTLFDSIFVRRYVEDKAGWYFTADDPVEEIITAIVFYIDGSITIDDEVEVTSTSNPILFATTRGCGTSTVVHDNSLYGVAQSYVGLSAEADLLTVSNARSTFAARHCLLSPGLPPWESSHSQHLWIEPQRANLIANPAFQDASLFGWRTPDDTTLARVTGGVSSWRNPAKCGRLYGLNPSKKLESNFFPNISEWYSGSFSVSASNACSIRYGLVAFDTTYTKPRYLVSDYLSINTSGSASTGFFRIKFLTKMFLDAVDLCFRLEIEEADEAWVSDVLIDPHPGQYEYFDGECPLGSPGDFRWMGAEDDRHFSLWYNNYRNTRNRVIGGYDSSDGRYKPGLVEEWAPTGATIVAHWDAVTPITPQNWSGDAYHTLSDVHGSEPTLVLSSSEYRFDLSPRRTTGDIPYVLDSDPDNPSRPILDEDGSVLL